MMSILPNESSSVCPTTKNVSEVAALLRKIEDEYTAASRVLYGFTPTARHDYITAREANIADHFEQLAGIIGKQQAIALTIDTLMRLE
jgi:hypothetical protein